MSELKYRAWDKIEKVMVFEFFISSTGDVLTKAPKRFNHSNHEIKERDYLEVMQYTGIKDVNGLQIFKGDIIVVRENATSNWSSCGAEVFLSHEYVGGWVISSGGQNLNLGTRTENIKKIGNIYENPELLNNKSK